jgi:hypothetical protein
MVTGSRPPVVIRVHCLVIAASGDCSAGTTLGRGEPSLADAERLLPYVADGGRLGAAAEVGRIPAEPALVASDA